MAVPAGAFVEGVLGALLVSAPPHPESMPPITKPRIAIRINVRFIAGNNV